MYVSAYDAASLQYIEIKREGVDRVINVSGKNNT